MPRYRPEIVTCQNCEGTGMRYGETCTVCAGVPDLDFAAIAAMATRIEGLLMQNVKLHNQIKRLSRGEAQTKRIVADYVRALEQKVRA